MLHFFSCNKDKNVYARFRDGSKTSGIAFRPNSNPNYDLSGKSILGTWVYSFPFYDAVLNIKSDGTFSWFDWGCTGKTYSEGNWQLNGNIVSLQSYEKYNYQQSGIINQSVLTTIVNSSVSKKSAKIKRNSNSEIIFSDIHELPDTLNAYFNKQMYSFEGDTLFSLPKYDGNNARFVKVK